MSKPIKMTEQYMAECRADFEKALQLTKLADGKLSFTKVFTCGDRKATVVFTAGAWAKMALLVKEFDKEVAWHGVAHRATDEAVDEYIIEDIVVYPQEVSGTTVEMDTEKYAEWLMQNADDERFNNIHVNNETGAVNPIEEIGTICMKRGILFHTDCVQAAGCHPIDVEKIGCDFLSLSSHKIHGPKGVGTLFAKDKSVLTPIIFGGAEQEFGLRAGTENVAGIVGFGEACEISSKSLHEDCIWVSTLKQRFYMALTDALKKSGRTDIVRTNGPSVLNPGKTLNLCLSGIDGQTLLLMLDGKNICISAGSACRSHEAEPSHVLTAMGLTADEARSSIRISFSRMNTADEAVDAANIIASCIEILANEVAK